MRLPSHMRSISALLAMAVLRMRAAFLVSRLAMAARTCPSALAGLHSQGSCTVLDLHIQIHLLNVRQMRPGMAGATLQSKQQCKIACVQA